MRISHDAVVYVAVAIAHISRPYDLKEEAIKDRLNACKPSLFLGAPLVWAGRRATGWGSSASRATSRSASHWCRGSVSTVRRMRARGGAADARVRAAAAAGDLPHGQVASDLRAVNLCTSPSARFWYFVECTCSQYCGDGIRSETHSILSHLANCLAGNLGTIGGLWPLSSRLRRRTELPSQAR